MMILIILMGKSCIFPSLYTTFMILACAKLTPKGLPWYRWINWFKSAVLIQRVDPLHNSAYLLDLWQLNPNTFHVYFMKLITFFASLPKYHITTWKSYNFRAIIFYLNWCVINVKTPLTIPVYCYNTYDNGLQLFYHYLSSH
jgi:hypothetical protein